MTQNSEFSPVPGVDLSQVMVGTWLVEDQWKTDNYEIPQTTWAIRATDSSGRTVVIAQPAGVKDFLLIQGDVALDEATKERIRQINGAELDSMLWNLRRELISNDVEFRIAGEPLALVQVSQRIFFGRGHELNKDVFFQRVSRVRRGILLVRWLIERWAP